MSFKLFVYYCSLCGGWAAFLAWALVCALGIPSLEALTLQAALIGGLAGTAVAAAVGAVDAVQQSPVWRQRLPRIGVCALGGLLGGTLGGTVGEELKDIGIPNFVGWTLAGVAIGASVGVYDVLLAWYEKREIRLSLHKVRNGLFGGLAGGLAGGLLYWGMNKLNVLPLGRLAWGLVIIGVAVGLLVGLAQVVLKEAWLHVEVARRPGKEIIINKDAITIGRSEACDVGLFGEQGVEKEHARIVMQDNRYLLAPENTPEGTYLNEKRVRKPTPLKAGDAIRLGSCVLRFNERAKK